MEGEETPVPQDNATFNNAAMYCYSLIIIERNIADAFIKRDYIEVNEGLEIFWMELSEWFNDEEIQEQEEIRQQALQAVDRISIAIKNKRPSVNTNDVEILKRRTISLKKIMHKYGVRMYRSEDVSGIPVLSRPAKSNFRRF